MSLSIEITTAGDVEIVEIAGAGPQGAKGDTGDAATVDVGTTSAVNPDQPPAVTNSGSTSEAVLDFALPRAAVVSVGTVTTVPPGTDAEVTDVGTDGDVVLDFAIPQGEQGPVGPQGFSFLRESRSDWVEPNSYIGIAALGSAESDAVWKITRITVVGTTVTIATAEPVAWDDRLVAVYA